MPASNSIPCIKLPNPKPLKISLPLGGELKSVMDISKGPPSDCTLIHGLMLQLAPTLAGLECFLKLVKLISALKNISPTTFGDIISAATDFLSTCLPVPIKFACTILDVVKLIIAYLKCVIQAVESILNFQVGINLGATDGNPILKASLNCAQNNADASTAQIKEALAAVQSLLTLIEPVLEVAEPALPGPVKDALKAIPDILAALGPILEGGGAAVGVPGTQDIVRTLDDLKSTLEQLEQTLDAIPC